MPACLHGTWDARSCGLDAARAFPRHHRFQAARAVLAMYGLIQIKYATHISLIY
jgi:hypothetical protein